MTLEESINEEDQVLEDQEIKVVLESRLLPFAQNAVIDFRKSVFGHGQFQVLTGHGC